MTNRVQTKTIRTQDELQEMVDYYLTKEAFAFDIESMGVYRGIAPHNRVVWLSFATHGRADVVPIGHPNGRMLRPGTSFKEAYWHPDTVGKRGTPLKKWRSVQREPAFAEPPEQLRPTEAFNILRPLFFSDRVKVGHNVKFDLVSVAKYYDDTIPLEPYFDTLGAAKLLLEEKERAGLKPLVKKYFEHDYDQENVGKCVERHAFDKVALYAYLDAKYTWELYLGALSSLEEEELRDVFDLEMDVLRVLCDMLIEGVPVDITPLPKLAKNIEDEMHDITRRVWEEVGARLDFNKTLHIRQLVYDIRGHEPFAFTDKTKELPEDQRIPSTSKGVLEVYKHDWVVADVLKWRELSKLYGTYIGQRESSGKYSSGMFQFAIDGRIHTNLNQFGAATGRFSSSEPNLQNIPARGETGAQIRKFIVAPPGQKLLVVDYSQIEYRVLAHYSGDPTLTQAFFEGWDPHQATAALLLDKELDEVTKEERDRAKTTNFAQVYGAGAAKIAASMGVTREQAYAIFGEYERRFPDVVTWKKEAVREARRQEPPAVFTISGRRRVLRPLRWTDDALRSSAERQVVNTICQGTAADIMKMAMVEVHKKVPREWRMLLTVHDELVMAVPEEQGEEAETEVKKMMVDVNPLSVPLEVDGGLAANWGDAK